MLSVTASQYILVIIGKVDNSNCSIYNENASKQSKMRRSYFTKYNLTKYKHVHLTRDVYLLEYYKVTVFYLANDSVSKVNL
jgi:predicted secreted protein